ncbi:MAG: hypothetical protein K0R83_2816 [Caulobacter sp.]|jgi:predicted histidine transporter YuiF (NhaC family)|nr:hypothetical protein [Caulobacter sp.]
MNAVSSPRRRLPRGLILGGIGMVFGLGLGIVASRLARSGVIALDELRWSDHAALVIAVIFMGLGLVIALASFHRKAAAKMLDPESGRPATPAQASLYRQQGLVLFLAGAMMGAPVATALAFDPLPMPIASAVMLAIVAAFLVQTVYNLVIWRRGDELMRQVMSETGAVCFWVLQGLLFLWAAAEKLSLAPALSAWDMMTVLMGFYLMVSSAMSIRRGVA